MLKRLGFVLLSLFVAGQLAIAQDAGSPSSPAGATDPVTSQGTGDVASPEASPTAPAKKRPAKKAKKKAKRAKATATPADSMTTGTEMGTDAAPATSPMQ